MTPTGIEPTSFQFAARCLNRQLCSTLLNTQAFVTTTQTSSYLRSDYI